MEVLKELKSWHLEGSTLVLDGGWEGSIRLTPALPGVVQVRLQRGTPWSREAPAPSLTVDPASWPDLAPPVVVEQAEHLWVFVAGVRVRVDRAPVRLQYWTDGAAAEPAGDPLLAEHPQGGLWKDGWQVGARFALHPEDRFYGLGEPDQWKGPIPFNHRGRRYPIWAKHLPAPSRLVLPVLVSHRGYGLFIDNPWAAEWDLGATTGDTFSYTAQGGQLVYYFIAGPALTDVLDRYTALTGRPALAPKWSFGLLQSKFGYKSTEEVEALVETFRARQIPLDGVILDLYWFRKMGDLAFNRSGFPDPAGMMARLGNQGVKIITIEEPFVTVDSRLFPEAERLGLLGKRPDGSTYTFPFWAGEAGIVDFTQPLARQWWADQHKPLMDQGVAGWWTDLNEPEEHPIDMVHQGGIAPAVHNIFPLLMTRALKLAQEQHKPDSRLFVLSRSGWPGTQALGAGQWSGDVESRWDAFADQIPLGLSMSMIGMVYWNTDIGGFTGPECTPELYIRWMQFGAFTPVMRPHGAQRAREPWAFGPEAEAIVTRYVRLRYRLLPYTYTVAREAYTKGMPFMRPLVLHYPEDLRTTELRDQYLWGRDLLVAPVVTPGATSRKVYLPEGDWYEFATNRRVRGGRHVTAAAPLETLPLYVRAGAIIPLAPERPSTGGAWEELTLTVYPGTGPSTFTLYEDDGESLAFERGQYTQTTFTWDGETLSIGEAGTRVYNLQLRLPRRPATVVASAGGEVPARRSAESLGKAARGWWYDQRLKVLHVKLGAICGPVAVTVK